MTPPVFWVDEVPRAGEFGCQAKQGSQFLGPSSEPLFVGVKPADHVRHQAKHRMRWGRRGFAVGLLGVQAARYGLVHNHRHGNSIGRAVKIRSAQQSAPVRAADSDGPAPCSSEGTLELFQKLLAKIIRKSCHYSLFFALASWRRGIALSAILA